MLEQAPALPDETKPPDAAVRGGPELRVLGPLEVSGPSGDIVIGSGKQRRLLAALVVQAGSVVSTDRLIDILWGDDPPPSALNALQTYVARLRETLRAAWDGTPPIISRAPGYVFQAERHQIDALRFELAVTHAREESEDNPESTARSLERALAWWRGPAYAEFAADDFARAEAIRLDELRLSAIEMQAAALLAMGNYKEAVAGLEALVTDHPLREEALALLMTSLFNTGRAPEALTAYREYRSVLEEELGLDPSASLQRLEHDILLGSAEVGASAPAPSGPTRRRLPAPASSFVGRERERSEIVDMLRRHRVVTISGPGGVGKTTLALHSAADVEGGYPDGVWMCELGPVRAPESIPYAIAASMGIILVPDRSPEHALTAALGNRRLLLVLDNCEHLLEAAAPLVESIIRQCPAIAILVTSRERLGVEGEHVWPLGPLAVPEQDDDTLETVRGAAAVVLFAERARAVRPGFKLNAGNSRLVSDVCRNLDGLPLALELAAARLAALTLEDLAARLGRLDILSRSGRPNGSRHSTLRQVIDWSYELLGEPESRLFERLSVFAGGFTLEHAEEVCADEHVPAHRVVELLASLIDKSMVVRPDGDTSGRYRMLETLRDYAHERLDTRGEGEAFRRAQARCLTSFAEQGARQMEGPDERAWISQIESEVDNLRIAHRWAVNDKDVDIALRLSAALHRWAFWKLRYEILEWGAEAAEMDAANRHPLVATVLASAGIAAWTRGDLAEAKTIGERASALAGPTSGLPLELLGDVAQFEGRPRDADDLYARAALANRAAGEVQSEVFNQGSRAVTRAYAGDVDGAQALAADTWRLARASANPTSLAWALFSEGDSLLERDPGRAVALLEESLQQAESAGNDFIVGVAGVSIASMLGRHGDPRSALLAFRAVVDGWRKTGNWMQQVITLRNLADLLVRMDEYAGAALLYGAASGADNVATAYGPEAARIESARQTLEDRLGGTELAKLTSEGRHLTGKDAGALAAREIDRILTSLGE